MIAGVSPNIDRSMHVVKLLYGTVSVDFDFCNEIAMKRVAKTIVLIDSVAKINDPQRIVTTSGPRFDDWQWRLATLPFAFGGLCLFCMGCFELCLSCITIAVC
ncbi:hypothetical protein Tco_1240678 [Tanacetum coccineum]